MSDISTCGQFAYPKNVQEISEQIKAHFNEMQVIKVEMQLQQAVLSDYISVEFKAIQLEAEKLHITLPFNEDKFKKYCQTFIVSRVNWVNGDMRSVIIRPEDHVMCPALLDAVCKNIGLVLEMSQGLRLEPTVDATTETLTVPEMQEVSFYLESIPSYVGGWGYIKDKSGSWEFMSMQLVEKAIMNEQAHHPAYSLLASIVGPKWIGAATAPRIKYGDLSMYRGLLWQLTTC